MLTPGKRPGRYAVTYQCGSSCIRMSTTIAAVFRSVNKNVTTCSGEFWIFPRSEGMRAPTALITLITQQSPGALIANYFS